MDRKLLISAGPGEWRAALLEQSVAVELYVERGDRSEAGSIHLGRVVRLLPALGAVLVDIGSDRPAFLPKRDVVPRGKQLHEGERVIVQIHREAQGGKAARVTMKRLPTLALRGSSGSEMESADETEIPAWHDLLDRALQLDPPAPLGPKASFAAALAASLPSELDEIFTDDPVAIPEVRAAFTGIAAAHRPDAEWPTDLDTVFDEALANTLALPGGGFVHFEPTRAGTLIDVDTGSPEAGSPERTGLAANLSAAVTIGRQIRLRNLAGGIVIDFVGLDGRPARDKVRAALAQAIAPDPASPQLLGWTRLGHCELVRPRRRRPLAEALLEARPGGALVKTAITVAHEALRALRRAARAQPGQQWRLTVAPDIGAALTGPVAGAVRQAEQRFARGLAIEVDPGRDRERFQISAL